MINYPETTDESISLLTNLRHLGVFSSRNLLSRNNRDVFFISDESIKNLTNLTSLNPTRNRLITDKSLRMLPKLTRIGRLSVQQGMFSIKNGDDYDLLIIMNADELYPSMIPKMSSIKEVLDKTRKDNKVREDDSFSEDSEEEI